MKKQRAAVEMGPPRIGETVTVTAKHCNWRGTLLNIVREASGTWAAIGVVGYSDTLVVPYNATVPVRG